MNDPKCMLGKYRGKNAACNVPAECQNCGHEIHEADRRERIIHTHGLTQRVDGRWGLVIRK